MANKYGPVSLFFGLLFPLFVAVSISIYNDFDRISKE